MSPDVAKFCKKCSNYVIGDFCYNCNEYIAYQSFEDNEDLNPFTDLFGKDNPFTNFGEK